MEICCYNFLVVFYSFLLQKNMQQFQSIDTIDYQFRNVFRSIYEYLRILSPMFGCNVFYGCIYCKLYISSKDLASKH